jgi:hypothetical protein
VPAARRRAASTFSGALATVTPPGARTVKASGSRPAARTHSFTCAASRSRCSIGIIVGIQPSAISAVICTLLGFSVAR